MSRLSAAAAGVAGTLVWAGLEPLDKRVFRHDYSDVAMLGKFVTRGRAWPVAGLAIHAANGAAFGLAYAELRRHKNVSALRLALAEHLALFPLGYAVDRLHPARGELGLARLFSVRAFGQATVRARGLRRRARSARSARTDRGGSVTPPIPEVVLAPLAGGPSTPELAAAVANAGGLGFVAGGYLAADELASRLRRARELTDGALGVNLFVLHEQPIDEEALAAYAAQLAREGYELGEPRFDDDALDEKIEVALAADVQAISTTFGPPPPALLERARVPVWATIASPEDADVAGDVLVVQGAEAGGHRGAFDDTDESDLPLLELLDAVRARTDRPLVAAGGIATRAAAKAALEAGAVAVQAGTAFLLCYEAGTHAVHRKALRSGDTTALTRAFTGRRARGIENAFMRDHPNAPSAYPHVHHLTAPMRAAARAAGDPERVNLWAGTAFSTARGARAADVVASLRV